MKGFYYEFARLAIRLLLAIYHQRGDILDCDRSLLRDAVAFLERPE